MRNPKILLLASLFACMTLSATSAQEACIAPDLQGQIKRLDFSDTSIVRVESRSEDVLTYSAQSHRGTTTIRSYRGLLTLETSSPVSKVTFDWGQDAARIWPLEAGKTFIGAASVKSSTNDRVYTLRTEVTVVGQETIRIAGCDYQVWKLRTLNRLDDNTMSETTRWYHAPSMLTLQTYVDDPKEQKRLSEFTATSVE